MKALTAELARLVGEDGVVTAREAREHHSQDVWTTGGLVDLVVRPKTQEAAAAALAACARAGVPVYPRGGGMSYTAGYLGERGGGMSLDTSRLTRIVEIDETDRFVRVEAGCTWAALHEALKPKGLRTPFWGPLSGLASTIGGGVSQNNAFFGAGTHGPTGQSVLSSRSPSPTARS
ncbi:FAD-binding oxidoreductase [Marinicauda algicola]|uniref:FAD-binding oxidoreductase n=1 Tax=Marinicauda algicola TaxID=2029849 RepID=UPI0019CFCDE8|nr:FAD-binding oxidoreductase [Marinicauda algicola]